MSSLTLFLIWLILSHDILFNNALASSTSPFNVSVSRNVPTRPFVGRALFPSEVTATILSEENPISESLFGALGPQPATAEELLPYVHPRIVMGAKEWDELITRYADPAHFDRDGSWSKYHRGYTLSKGPLSEFISETSTLGDFADLYTGGIRDLHSLSEEERARLKTLADRANKITELKAGSLFMCAFWANVNRKRMQMGYDGFLREDMVDVCVQSIVGWATIMLAHRAYHCVDGECEGVKIWDFNKRWEVWMEWHTASMSMGMAYDVLYHDMKEREKRTVRSALALLVMKRYSWGNSEFSNRWSPNAALHPHRIFSNWAMYHSNLYLANLAIEGEHDVDVYTKTVLQQQNEQAFNTGLKTRFEAMIQAYMTHSFYPDGTTFEDGYSYFIALREGSLGLLAAHRRGLPMLGTARFRNIIHNAVQMYEPWPCGQLIGHASGGGNSYPAHMALFRYTYPEGVLPNMMWRQRMGEQFRNNAPCRTEWFQNMVQLTVLGGEHGEMTEASSLEGLAAGEQGLVPRSFYGTRRGLLIARNDYRERSSVVHFDVRGDGFFPGHDNADRGVFTVSMEGRTWIGELDWKENADSRKHSLMHVDGLGEDEKAPCGRMGRVKDEGGVVVGSGDLTYAYNVQWARNWPDGGVPRRYSTVYGEDGVGRKVYFEFGEREYGDAREFGWPQGDDGRDLGLDREESNLFGDEEVGFRGMWTWKRRYREVEVEWGVRSVALVREESEVGVGFVVVVDSFRMMHGDDHLFEEYLILEPGVRVEDQQSWCEEGRCQIALTDGAKWVDVYVMTLGREVQYREELFNSNTNRRLIIQSADRRQEEVWMAFVARAEQQQPFEMIRLQQAPHTVQIRKHTQTWHFSLNTSTHSLHHLNP